MFDIGSPICYTAVMNISELLSKIDSLVEKHGSQKALAQHLGISQQYLNDVVRLRRDPSEKLLKSLGLKKVISYERR